jgi:hypothetical protein
MRRRGEVPKDHAKENALLIKKLQREHELKKELAVYQEKPVFKLKRFSDVPSTHPAELAKACCCFFHGARFICLL